jgi:hypothetical protein
MAHRSRVRPHRGREARRAAPAFSRPGAKRASSIWGANPRAVPRWCPRLTTSGPSSPVADPPTGGGRARGAPPGGATATLAVVPASGTRGTFGRGAGSGRLTAGGLARSRARRTGGRGRGTGRPPCPGARRRARRPRWPATAATARPARPPTSPPLAAGPARPRAGVAPARRIGRSAGRHLTGVMAALRCAAAGTGATRPRPHRSSPCGGRRATADLSGEPVLPVSPRAPGAFRSGASAPRSVAQEGRPPPHPAGASCAAGGAPPLGPRGQPGALRILRAFSEPAFLAIMRARSR